jgi:hypothetical protein
MEKSVLGLLSIVVLLLVIMPALLYLLGWGVARYAREVPKFIGFPARPKATGGTPDREAPAQDKT